MLLEKSIALMTRLFDKLFLAGCAFKLHFRTYIPPMTDKSLKSAELLSVSTVKQTYSCPLASGNVVHRFFVLKIFVTFLALEF